MCGDLCRRERELSRQIEGGRSKKLIENIIERERDRTKRVRRGAQLAALETRPCEVRGGKAMSSRERRPK